jgi:hypothetical protein
MLRPSLMTALAWGALYGPAAAERMLPWNSFSRDVASALHAFRQTDNWVAQGMARNMDGDRLGLNNDLGLPYNFDPLRHLLFVVHDFNGDGSPEVILLFDWPAVRGTQQAVGVVMVGGGRSDAWRIGCEISDWGDAPNPHAGIHMLNSRSHGWRNFRTSDAVYHWRPVRGQRGAMECHGVSDWPPRRRTARR